MTRRGGTPGPDGEWPGSGNVVSEPRMSAVCTASPSMSENHSSPSNQRGPSPKQKPLASGVGDHPVMPLQITAKVSRTAGVGVNPGGRRVASLGVQGAMTRCPVGWAAVRSSFTNLAQNVTLSHELLLATRPRGNEVSGFDHRI